MSAYIPVFTSAEGKSEVIAAYQAIIDRWPVPYQELTVTTSFGETHMIASGPKDAQPVVLLHALFATATSWYRNVEALSKSYRVYAVDINGEVNKSCPTRPFTSLDDFLHWFTEVIDHLGLKTLYVAGNSYGGLTGAYYAMKLPERITKLVLIGPAATIYPMLPFYLHMFIPKAMYLFFPRLPGLKRVMRRSVDWMYHGLPCDPLWDTVFYRTLVHGSAINQVFPRVYSKEEFAQIRAKVLVILGKHEMIYNNLNSAIRAVQGLLPSAHMTLIPDAHHITALAQPELINECLLKFFAE